VASGPLPATFPIVVKTSSYATGLQLNFPEQIFYKAILKMLTISNQRGFSKRYLFKSQLIEANADNEAIHYSQCF